MDDRLRETLSAMMDDEADELAVRRLLASPEREEVSAQWLRWQRLRDLMHGSGPRATVDVAQSVRVQLTGVPATETAVASADPGNPASPRWRWSAMALVTLSILIGFGMGAGWDAANPESATQVAIPGGAEKAADNVPRVALQGLDQQQWETLSRYLLEHAQHNSVGAGRGAVGYARLASVSGHGR